MHKTFSYFIVGLFTGMALMAYSHGPKIYEVDETGTLLHANGRPYRNSIRWIGPLDGVYNVQHYPYGYYRFEYNPYSRGNNSGESKPKGTTNTNTWTKSFNHTGQERQDSWGNKN